MSIRALIEVNCDRFMLPAIDRKLVSTATHDVVARDRLRQIGVRFMGERHHKDTGLIAEDEWRNMNDLDALTAKDAEIERLGYKIAQAYQTFGRLLDLCGIFETRPAQDILDYFSTAEDHVDEKWVEDYRALASLIRKASVQADGSVTHSLYGSPGPDEPPDTPTGDTRG